jgi:PAS domain-containing protein
MGNELIRVIDALPELVWTALPYGHIDFLNQRWCEYTGLSVDEAYGSPATWVSTQPVYCAARAVDPLAV